MSVVVITGAGQGQGAAETRLLAARGATVVAADLGEAPAEALPGAEYRQLDVTDQAGWTALAEDLGKRYGRVDGLVANAARHPGQHHPPRVHRDPDDRLGRPGGQGGQSGRDPAGPHRHS